MTWLPMVLAPEFSHFAEDAIRRSRVAPVFRHGRLVRLVGLTLEATGLSVPHGALCSIESLEGRGVTAEVVGFHEDITYLMPFGEPVGIAPGATVRVLRTHPKAPVGPELLARVLDANGAPLDGMPAPICEEERALAGVVLNPLERAPIRDVLDVGIKAINGLLTIGRGQRVGLMAGSGVGKSVLLGMMTRFTEADVVVIGLIGERGREVSEFIRDTLGPEGMKKSVVIAAPANVSPVLRLRATHYTHLIAEYFRDQGKNVLMLVDSLTRVAHAQREIGLAIGEPPTAKGYPPSVFALLPGLIERGGVGRDGKGSVTALYTVLMEGDDSGDPVVDIARASLDGQVMLSRSLADAAHYPAIDLMGSISRAMPNIVDLQARESANRLRRLWTLFQQNADLIQVGAYQAGSNPELDTAIALREKFAQFLRQDMHSGVDYRTCRTAIEDLLSQG
jgi:flagellum-specific ATP synthase